MSLNETDQFLRGWCSDAAGEVMSQCTTSPGNWLLLVYLQMDLVKFEVASDR